MNYNSENLDLKFFTDFFPNDSSLYSNMLNAFSFQSNQDSSYSKYFFKAFFLKSGPDAYENINIYTNNQPLDIRGRLFYAN